jgi:hypothetical protein
MINQGVKQGCPLSPVLFNLYIYDVIIELQKELRNHYLIEHTQLNVLLYADDQIVLADSEDNLQRTVPKLWLISNQYDLNISPNKTKVMAFIRANTIRTKIVINDQIIEQVNSFNYLGCNLSYTSSRDTDNKLAKFQQLIGTVKRTLFWNVRHETVIKFYKTLALSTLLYGSEAWALTSAQIKRTEAAEMKLLRPLAGNTLSDHIRNEDTHQKLEIENVTIKISTYRNKWLNYLERTIPDRIPYKLLKHKPTRKRSRGKLKKQKDQF